MGITLLLLAGVLLMHPHSATYCLSVLIAEDRARECVKEGSFRASRARACGTLCILFGSLITLCIIRGLQHSQRQAMRKEHLHETSVMKPGKGERIFLAFAGRRHHSDTTDLSAKSDAIGELIRILLLIAFAGMIGIVLWRHLFANR